MEKKILEKDIQREICEYLTNKGIFFWRNNNVPIFGRSNDGIKRFRAMPKYTPKGLPDIICLHKGIFLGLEVKRPESFLKNGTPEQRLICQKIIVNGGVYKIVFSVSDVENLFLNL